MVQAFAHTIVDDTRRTAAGGKARSSFPGRASTPPPSVPLPEIGDVVGGHYKLDSLLGQGMFGKVYVAQRLDVPEHRVALKLLPRSLYVGRNVERELVMLATVGHPNVVQLKDHGTTPDYVWLTMPVYHGQTLAERLEQGTLSPREAYEIFLPVARGLEALHAAGLRHQDVKPENIYLAVFAGRVHPILLDLGVAAEKDATFVAGTALFAAPEQVTVLAGLPAFQPLSEKMDTYGLAATLLLALCGPKRFPGEEATDRSELAEAQEVRTTAPLGPATLPEVTGEARDALADAFRRWLSHDPADRPTMKELAEQLEILLEPEREDERREERRRERQKDTIARLRAGVGAMLLVGAAGASIAYTRREELTLATQLAAARRQGEASFTQLDTCAASHRIATKDAADCQAARDKAQADFKRSLGEVMASGSTSQAEHAREVQRTSNRIKALEDSLTAARRAADDDAKRVAAASARERAEITAERDAARTLLEREKTERATAEATRDALKGERNACLEERDACRAAAKATPPPAPRPAPSTSAAPGAGPVASAAAAVTAEPAAPPPPSPPPAPVPPATQPQQQPAQIAPPGPRGAPAQPAPDPQGS